MAKAITTDSIRAWAMALPEVTEKEHFRFKVPSWQVQGRSFLGMGRDETTAVFMISEESANALAAADPEHAEAVRRLDAHRSFLGLQLRLDGIPPARVQALVRESWMTHAPQSVIRTLDGTCSD